MRIETTAYYDEMVRYAAMAKHNKQNAIQEPFHIQKGLLKMT